MLFLLPQGLHNVNFLFVLPGREKLSRPALFLEKIFLPGPPSKYTQAPMTTNKHVIVYAEDDLDDLFLVKQAFEMHDHIEVLHAPDGQKALHLLEGMLEKNVLPCLVILDVNMPVLNGREALQAIRNHPHLNVLNVVLFTTSNSSADIAFAKSLNASFVTKPIDYNDLEAIARRFVDQCNFEINKLSASKGD